MFSTAGLKFSTMLSTVTRLSRVIRRHMREVVDSETEVRSHLLGSLEVGRKQGDVDTIMDVFEKIRMDLFKRGGKNLLDLEQKTEAAELKISDDLDELPAFLDHLRKHVNAARSAIGEAEAKAIIAMIDKAERDLSRMYDVMLDEIKKEYTSAFAEARGVETGGEDEHSRVAEKRGLTTVMLAGAMRDVFKLRSDKKEVEHDETALEELDNLMEHEIAKMEHRHEQIPKLVKQLEAQAGDLTHITKSLLDHVTTVFHRFTLIMKVFTTYFFMIQDDEHHVKRFLEMLGEEGFPENNLHKMQQELKREDADMGAILNDITNVFAHMRHTPMAGHAKAA